MNEAQEQNRGLTAIIVLAVLTAVEYVIAVGIDSMAVVVTLLSIIGLAKAGVIIEYFMHLSKLWRGEGAHE